MILDITGAQLRAFMQVVEQGSFSAAADALNISQASVSKHVRAIERKTGVLFVRKKGSGVHLTSAGQILYERGPGLLAYLSDVTQALADAASARPRLRVGVGEYLLSALQGAVTDYLLKFPQEIVELRLVGGDEGQRLLDRGELDLVLITRAEPPPGLDARSRAAVTLRLYRASNASLSDHPLPVIMPPAGSAPERFVERVLRNIGCAWQPHSTNAPNYTVVQELCMRGVGVALLFEESTTEAVAAGRLVAVSQAVVAWRCCLTGSGALSSAAQRFSQFAIHGGVTRR
ncbi:LysR family transcriptional regulator [Altericroceibacterium xinjiangense]|uniref:LysR family transcriptional regulator n=1 Tax=Altericroceibacterium xinjiangense TaxID=762261 RepID=UPI000F7F2158|nr:LysR family transcriptional regulator [Altericroceibacterium xinjiangense]